MTRSAALFWSMLVRSLLVATILAGNATAQPLPGGAPGSGTGDSGAPYAGLASVPEANLFTGAAQTSIPIEVPPGRLGLAPVLALSWSSVSPASGYGDGWSLPLPRVYRSTREGVPRYDDRDTFVLEAAGAVTELERVPGSAMRYRAQVESAFLRIGHDAGANSWKVVDKLGVSFTFGSSAASRTGRGSSRGATFSWLLDSIEDAAGNRVEFEYRGGGDGGSSSGLPVRIRYGANAKAGLAHFAEVVFTWTPRGRAANPRVSYRAGYAERLDVRLASIETFTHGLAARRYDFSHDEDAVTGDLRLAGVTLTAFAALATDDVRLPSTVFLYAPALHRGWPALGEETEGAPPFVVPRSSSLRIGTKTVTGDTFDIDGDGLVDRVDTGMRPPQVLAGDGESFGAGRAWNWPASSGSPRWIRKVDGAGNLVTNTFDLDGDGFADLVDADPLSCGAPAGHWCVWRGGENGLADAATAWKAPRDRLRVVEGSGSRVVADVLDVDADGRPDFLDASAFDASRGVREWLVWRNDGHAFAAEPARFAAPLPFVARSSADRMVWGLMDLNADALPDLVVAGTDDASISTSWGNYARWHYYPNVGDGLAAQPVEWPLDGGVGDGTGLPNFLNLKAEDGSTLADVFDITGDGRPDLVRRQRPLEPLFTGLPGLCGDNPRCSVPTDPSASAVSPGFCCYNLLVFVNTGSSFSQPVAWSAPTHGLRADHDACPDGATYGCTSVYDFDFFDFDGDGLVDFVERYTAGGDPLSWVVHPHPASARGGGARPNLLVAMRNGIGGETVLRYTTAQAAPGTRLPYPHWMVASRELVDSVADTAPLRTSFAYRGGYFDRERREMRGFAVVARTEPAGVTTVHEFHQDRRLAGRPRRVRESTAPSCRWADSACASDDGTLSVRDLEWSADGPVLLRSESDVPWHQGAPVENLRRTTTWRHDAYGNVTGRRTTSPLSPPVDTWTTFEHRVADTAGGLPSLYSVAKPTRTWTTEDGRDAPLVEKAFEYRWQGSAPGLLVAASTCIAWDGAACARWSRRTFEHDAAGNVTVARSPDGASSRTVHDDNALFALRSTDPSGLVTSAATDPRTGLVTETVAPNGNRLRSRYDGLGRLLRAWGPGFTMKDPRLRHDYAPGGLGDGPPRVLTTDAGAGRSATFFDGLGRATGTKREATDRGSDTAVVSGLRLYDARGLVVAEALPFPSDDLRIDVLAEAFDDAPAWVEYRRDAVGRLLETRAPDGATVRFDPSSPGTLRTDDANLARGIHPGSVTLEFFDGSGRRLARDTCSAAPDPSRPWDCPAGALARRESWMRDGVGRVVEARTAALGQAAGDSVVRVQYDGLGNRLSSFHSDAGAWTFGHDDSGRLVDVGRPDGTHSRTKYDSSGRIVRRRGPTSSASYRYHAAGGGIGKVRRVVSRSSGGRALEEFEYDERGRVSRRRRRVSAPGGESASLDVRYEHDDLDRRIATTYAGWPNEGDAVVHAGFDRLGRPTTLATEESVYVGATQRDWAGRAVRVDRGNDTSDLAHWDSPSSTDGTTAQLRCLRTTATALAQGGACDWQPSDLDGLLHDGYDANGRLLEVADPLRSASDSLFDGRSYRYDALGRLASFRRGNGDLEDYAFDPLGNVVAIGVASLEYADASHPSRLTAVRSAASGDAPATFAAVEHDATGRRVRHGERRFEWDDGDRLAAVLVAGDVVLEHGYADSGERLWTRDARRGATSIELGDGVRVDDGVLERTLSFDGRPAVVDRIDASSTERSFLHADHQGTVRLVTDHAGRPVERSRHRPFGSVAVRTGGHDEVLADATTRFGFTGHVDDAQGGLLFLGARHYDPSSASFLSPDPALQFASAYAYSDGDPVGGRDADGRLFGMTGLEILVIATASATFVDSLVSTGDLGHSLTAGVFAGFSVAMSAQLSTTIARPLVRTAPAWLQMSASVASSGFQAVEALEAMEDGRYAGGIVAAGMLAASLIGIESANDAGPGQSPAEVRDRHGIEDRGMDDGTRSLKVGGICSTRPGCLSNTLVAAREDLRLLFGGEVACVGGCEHVAATVNAALERGENVRLHCNSFGAVKCLGAIQKQGIGARLGEVAADARPRLTVEMSGAPLLRPPRLPNVTYHVNLFDPVVWVGTAYSTPLRSDVVLGRNWWTPAPVLVHHSSLYERPFHEALAEIVP